VDDDESIAYMTRRRLALLGYQVTAKTSSIEALELFRSQPDQFDLVVTDQTMPGLTGEFWIRSDQPFLKESRKFSIR
jgi:CheY-like chemotaxis protein